MDTRQIFLIGLLAVALIGGWFLISSTTKTASNNVTALSERELTSVHEMDQLVSFLSDEPMQPHLPNHKFAILDDDTGVFLHFDAAYGQDSQLNWMGTLVPGVFCKADQERVGAEYGPGFGHFHKLSTPGDDPTAGHGGNGGEDGYWFRHIAVRNIEGVPWGPVSPGIDYNFMPTVPPDC